MESCRLRRWARRTLALFLACVLGPLLLLLLLEVGLRLAGLGYSTQFFLKRDLAGTPCYVANKDFYQQFYGLPLLRGLWDNFEFQIPRTKPPDVFRVFVFGESAALGQPPDPACSFWRMIETMLIARFPGVAFGFYTPAMPGANSHVMWAAARACARMQPDLFLVYMGNNEVCGPFGPVTKMAQRTLWSTRFIRANMWLTDLRMAQLLTGRLWQVDPRRKVVPEDLQQCLTVLRPEDPKTVETCAQFERNLSDICATGAGAGAGVIVCTVGSNVRNCGPNVSELRPGISDADRARWSGLFQEGVAAESRADYRTALERFGDAAAIDDTHAELAFRTGRCYWNLGEYEQAKEYFVRAREQDCYATRTGARLNAIMERVAQAGSGRGLYLVDAARHIEERSPHGIPGRECFYDNVHLTFHGHYVLARAVFEQVVQMLPDWVRQHGQAAYATPLSEDECAQRLALTPYVQQGHIAQFFNAMTACQDTILDMRETLALLRQRYDELRQQNGSEGLARTVDAYRQALQWNDRDYYIRKRYVCALQDLHRLDEMVTEAQVLLEHYPLRRDTRRLLANAFKMTGQDDAAIRTFQETAALYPDDSESYIGLGNILHKANRLDDALAMYRKGLAINPDDAYARNCEGLILRLLGRFDEAVAAYRDAIAADPQMPPAYEGLDQVYLARKDSDGRIAEWQGAVERYPREAQPCNFLAQALEAAGRPDEAAAVYRKAAENSPPNADAKTYLAMAFEVANDVNAAIAAYREALDLDADVDLACRRLDELLVKRGDAEARTMVWRAIADAHPDAFRAHFNVGKALAAQGDVAGAAAAFGRACELNPGNPVAQETLGRALAQSGEFAGAIRPLRAALQLNAGGAQQILPDLIRALCEVQDFAGAKQELDRCRQLGIGLPQEIIERIESPSGSGAP